jgi:YbbR domain-containing protein
VPIDINDLTKSVSRTVEINFPEGILPLDATSKNIEVGLIVEQNQQSIRLQVPVVIELRDVPADVEVRANPAIVMIEVIMSSSAMQRRSVNNIRAEVSVGTWDDGNTMRQVQLTIPDDIRLMSDIPVVQLTRISINGGSVNLPPITATTSIAGTLVPVVTVVITPVLTATPLPVTTGTVVATATKVDN